MLCPASTLYSEASDEDLRGISESFADTPPEVLLRWSLEEFGGEIALATGFGVEGCVLVDMLARIDRRARIFYLDTDLLFPKPTRWRNPLAARTGPCSRPRDSVERHGKPRSTAGVWKRAEECCRLRKLSA